MADPRFPSSSLNPPIPIRLNLALPRIPESQKQQGAAAGSQPSSSSSSSDGLYLAGFCIAYVVRDPLNRYDTKSIKFRPSPHPHLIKLVRDPLNPNDTNAIKVLNTRTQHVGHVDSLTASVLSPLIDSGLITVEGIVRKSAKLQNPIMLPFHVDIFTPLDSIETLQNLISESELCLVFSPNLLLRVRERVLAEKKPREEDILSYDQIFALVGAGYDGRKRRKIVEPPKDVISSELFLHQKEGLAWLIDRENSCELPPFWEVSNRGFYGNMLTNIPTKERPEPLRGGIFADDIGLGKTLTLLSLIATNRPGGAVPPFIDIGDDTAEDRVDKLHNVEQVTVPESKNSRVEKSGRRVASTGKKRKTDINDDTVEKSTEKLQNDEEEITISGRKKSRVEKSGRRVASTGKKRKTDINNDTVEKSTEKLQNDEEEITISGRKKSRVEKSGKRVADKRKIDVEREDLGPKATLIVCPPTVLSTWITQLDEHTRPGLLKVYLYYGERTTDSEELRRSDIVLTTYSTLSVEKKNRNSPIREIEWWRIILDEAHVIRNVAAQQSEAVIDLKGKRRWAVTSTPIQNGSFDLFSLMAFLNFHPFSIKSYWKSLVQWSLDQGCASGLSRLQALMRTVSLRRTKESHIGNKSLVGFPPKTVETCFVEFSAEEREQYDRMESEAKIAVDEFIRDYSLMRNYCIIIHIILRLRQICNCLDLCPTDSRSLFSASSLKDVSNNPELLTKMVSILQDGDFDCSVCLSRPTETVITSCAHIFCKSCILRSLQRLNSRCPICRNLLSKSDLFSAPLQPSDDNNPASYSAVAASSKVSTLLKLLVSSLEENPFTKSVIFSQFRKMLILLEQPLKAAGFGVLRLDGSMSAKKKSQVIKEFCDCRLGTPTVLLTSLKVAGAGLNLMAASRVYLLEPWWNPSVVEEQAKDRVHRIGQEEVKVVRLIMRNSIEERILKLQERKDLARGAFGMKSSNKLTVEDLRTIMQL